MPRHARTKAVAVTAWAKAAQDNGWEPVYLGRWFHAWRRGNALIEYELDDAGRLMSVGGNLLPQRVNSKQSHKGETLTLLLTAGGLG